MCRCPGKFSCSGWDLNSSPSFGCGFREVLEIEFESLLKIGDGIHFGGTETRNVVVEALGDVVGFLAVENVVEVFHRLKMRGKPPDGKEMGSVGGSRSAG